jgi:levanase/fructan beta-fructosidase
MTFTKYEANPVLMGDIADFRDPKVMWDGTQWVMTLACQQEIRFYGSSNLKEWTLLSHFGEGIGAHGGVWECPDLINMGEQWVLLVSINPGGPFGGSATQYFVGNWDGKEFSISPKDGLTAQRSNSVSGLSGEAGHEVKWLDYGKDNYSTFTWHNAPNNRIVSMGWMSNWQYAQQVPTVAFRSQNTIARELSLYRDDAGEYRVRVVPSPESWAIKGEPINQLNDACIIELTFTGDETGVITLSNDKGEKVTLILDVHRQTFSMDRTASGDCSFSADFPSITTVPLFKCLNDPINDQIVNDQMVNEKRITLFLDHCSIEAFDGDGAWAMTNLVFPSEPYNHIHVVGGEATIYDVKK